MLLPSASTRLSALLRVRSYPLSLHLPGAGLHYTFRDCEVWVSGFRTGSFAACRTKAFGLCRFLVVWFSLISFYSIGYFFV